MLSNRQKILITTALAALGLVIAGLALVPASAQAARCTWPRDTSELVFGRTKPVRIYGMNELLLSPMRTFLRTFRARSTPCYDDWTTDGCSVPAPLPNYAKFHRSCLRHDWGYRNLQAADRRYGHGTLWNENNKAAIDTRFLHDMRAKCSSMKLSFFQDNVCKNQASAYYAGVARYGPDFNTYEDWVQWLIPFD